MTSDAVIIGAVRAACLEKARVAIMERLPHAGRDTTLLSLTTPPVKSLAARAGRSRAYLCDKRTFAVSVANDNQGS